MLKLIFTVFRVSMTQTQKTKITRPNPPIHSTLWMIRCNNIERQLGMLITNYQGHSNFEWADAVRRSFYENKTDTRLKFKVTYSNTFLQILIKHPGLSFKQCSASSTWLKRDRRLWDMQDWKSSQPVMALLNLTDCIEAALFHLKRHSHLCIFMASGSARGSN